MLLGEVFWACVSGSRPRIRPRPGTAWVVPLERAKGNRQGDGEVWAFQLRLLSHNLDPDKRQKVDGRMDGFYFSVKGGYHVITSKTS